MIENDRLTHALLACENIVASRKSCKTKTIYLLKSYKYFKIGYASNFYERFCNYKVHNPLDTILICKAVTESYKQFEDWVKNEYIDRLHRGEWYLLTKDDVNSIKSKWFSGQY